MANPSFFIEIQNGGKPPLLLIHGFGAYGAFWRKWVAELAPRHRCYTVDLPGFGQSKRSSDPSPQGHAALLADFIEESSEDHFVLVGHSLGGGIALLAAMHLLHRGHRNRLRGLVLVSAAVYPQRFPPYISLARTRGVGEFFLLAPPPRWAIRRGLRGIVYDPDSIDDTQVESLQAPYLSRERRSALLEAARAIDPHAGEFAQGHLSKVDLPTLLLWGEEDPVVPVEYGYRLEQELPCAHLITLPRVGHLPPEEAPRESLDHLLTFLDGLEKGESTS